MSLQRPRANWPHCPVFPWKQPLRAFAVKSRISVGAASNSRILTWMQTQTATADRPERHPGRSSVPRVRTSPGNLDPRLQRLEGIPRASGTRPAVMQLEGLGL